MNAPTPTRKYDLGFARWVRDNIDHAERMNMCMQCGVCSGSCPLRNEMDNGPRKTFMMVRAGMKEEVLKSSTLWNCVSCYSCVVRCPREVPVKYILHGLLTYAIEQGYQEAQDTDNYKFASAFWNVAAGSGRVDERVFTAKFYLKYGIGGLISKGMANQKIAMGMIKSGRMPLFAAPHKIKGKGDLKKILAKAAEIEKTKHASLRDGER